MNFMQENVILLVEDDPDDVRMTLRAFRESNISNPVVVQTDGAAALAYLNELGKSKTSVLPAITLLDLGLPNIDGLELLQRIRSLPRLQRMPVVIVTASKEDSALVRSYELGANGYLHKPIDFHQFNLVARQLGLQWMLLGTDRPLEKTVVPFA